MGSLWNFHGILLDFYDITMGFKKDFLWGFHDASMIFPWESYWIPLTLPCAFHDVPMVFLQGFRGKFMGFLKEAISILSLKSSYEFFLGFLLGFHDLLMRLLGDFKRK